MKRPIVFICSPYRGDIEANTRNARRYCCFSYEQGGIPFAPHLLFTQFLDDSKEKERDAGLAMGVAMLELCDEIWVFGEPTPGMRMEIAAAHGMGKSVRRFDTNCREVTVHE